MTARRDLSLLSFSFALALSLSLAACADSAPARPALLPSPLDAPSASVAVGAVSPSSAPAASASGRAVAAPAGSHAVWSMLEGGLDVGPPNVAWATGQPQVHVTDNGVSDVFQDVDLAKVPPSMASLVGERVVLHTPDIDPGCPATITGLVLFTPSYGQLDTQSVVDHYRSTPAEKRATDPTLVATARSVLQSTSGYRALVATVSIDPAAHCTYAGTWAAPASSSDPGVVSFSDPPAALASKAQAAFRALPVFGAVQRAYAKTRKPTEPARWSDLPDYSEHFVVARFPDGRGILAASGSVCRGYTDFTMNLDVFFSVDADDVLATLPPTTPSEARWPTAIADIDHNGELDVLTLDGFLLARGGRLDQQVFTRGPIYTCPGDGAAAATFNAAAP